MSYIKNNWSEGDIITSGKLNNIENGIETNANDIANIPGYIANAVKDKVSIYDWTEEVPRMNDISYVMSYMASKGEEWVKALPDMFCAKSIRYDESFLRYTYDTWLIFKGFIEHSQNNSITTYTFKLFYDQPGTLSERVNQPFETEYTGQIVFYTDGVTSPTYRGGPVCEFAKATNVVANNWVSDNTYPEYPYKCDLYVAFVTLDSVMQVVFSVDDALSGNYAPVCLAGFNKVTIYGKVNTTITIPTIKEVV